ncbi:MAG: hypothetical protein ACI4VH_04385 [Clostridia bacterium]
MKKDYYDMLICINDCPDTYISKEIIFNVIKWNYGKIDSIIQSLKDEKLIDVYNFNKDVERYKLSTKGILYIKNYQENQKQKKLQSKKDFFDKYIFPTISAIIFFILGILASIFIK